MDDIDRSNCGGAARVKAYLEYIQEQKGQNWTASVQIPFYQNFTINEEKKWLMSYKTSKIERVDIFKI